MKGSSFVLRKAPLLIAAAWVAAHLPFLAPSLEDVDSINFALGLRDFDPGLHQPHPPGYPVYIALGRLALALTNVVWPGGGLLEREAFALAIWSAIGGGIAIVAAWWLFEALRPAGVPAEPRVTSQAGWAVALLAASPLFWLTGLRPMSDLPGLAAALSAQALALWGMRDRRLLTVAALIAALAAGMRIQTVLLTVPLLVLALVSQRAAGVRWMVTRPIAAFVAGGLAWGVPMLIASGGLEAYLAALETQAVEDFSWVNMLWMEPTPRRLAIVLYETLIAPWGSVILGALVLALAVAGAAVALVRDRIALATLVVAFAPYAAFHMLLHETVFTRYALPVVVPLAWLAMRAASAAGRWGAVVAIPLIAIALVEGVPAGVTYGREPHPTFVAIEEATVAAARARPAAVFAHHGAWRALQAAGGGLPVVEPRRQYEWLGLVEYWKQGGTAPVWFLADTRRTDLALIDPAARADVARYRWNLVLRPEFAGTRPVGTDWYRLSPPGWFAEEGWSLTPETGGIAAATQAGPGHRPIRAWVRRRGGPLHLVIGGRHLGAAGAPSALFELAIDGQVVDRWTLTREELNFVRFVDVPAIDGAGPLAELTVQARGSDGSVAEVAVRQFDIQSSDRLLVAFAEGWHEEELDVPTGRRWRWTSDRAVLRVKGPTGAVRITLAGESPLRYFDAPPALRVTAAGRVIDELRPDDDFDWTVTVPAADVARAQGIIVIESDQVYLPGVVEGTSDDRRLAFRLWETRVIPVTP
jgi:hypothetical protein